MSKNASRRKRNREYVWKYLETHPCVHCGETNPLFLDFDHLNPEDKYNNVSRMVTGSWSIEAIQKEIDKCQVLCVKCHLLKTAQDGKWHILDYLNSKRDE